MEVKDYLEILKTVKSVSMATTAKDGTPRSRIIDIMLIEDEKIYFLTARGKDFYADLMRTKRVALSAVNDEGESVRLWGRVENLGSDRLKELFQANKYMYDLFPGVTKEILEVFCIEEGEGEYYDNSRKTILRHQFAFGKDTYKKKGFEINSKCVGCGACQWACPQKCIISGYPSEIIQEHCIQCGRCMEVCPKGAVVKL